MRSLEKSIIFQSSFVESIFVNGFQLILITTTVQIDGYDSRVIVTSISRSIFGNLIKFIYFAKEIEFNLIQSIKYFLSRKSDDF